MSESEKPKSITERPAFIAALNLLGAALLSLGWSTIALIIAAGVMLFVFFF